MLTTVKVTILGTEGMLHIRMLHLMSILVYLTTLWTSIAFNVTWYPVLCSPSQLLFPLHHYLHIVCPRTHAHIHTHTHTHTHTHINTLWMGDADLRLYITTVQDGWRKSAFLTRAWFPRTIHLITQYMEPCLRMVLLMDVYRNVTSLWINDLWEI